MKTVIVRTRHEYGSYRDFWRLVELSSFETCYVEEMDLSADAIYIVTPINGEFRPHIEHCRKIGGEKRAIVAWWNLERPDFSGSPPLSTIVDDVLRYADVAWVGDRHYATLDSRMQHVVLGGHPGLCANFERREPQYDFTHQSYVWGRRDPIILSLRGAYREGPNGWFDERDATLKATRLIVNIHQTPALVGEPIRFAMSAAYKLPMVGETLLDPFPLVPGHDFIQADHQDIVLAVKRALDGPADKLREYGENLYQRLCVEWTFRRGVEEGVAETLRRRAS